MSDNSELTEATRLAKEIHKRTKQNFKDVGKIDKLNDLAKEYEPGSASYKLVMKQIKKLEDNDYTNIRGKKRFNFEVDSIGSASRLNKDFGRNAKKKQRDLINDDSSDKKGKSDKTNVAQRIAAILNESVSGDEFLDMYLDSIR